MSTKFGYSVRETAQNVRRNLSLTLASVLTVAVSLSLVGGAVLLRYGVNNVTDRWQNGVEFEVFLNSDASPEQSQRIGNELQTSKDVKRVVYISQEEQYKQFKLYFADQPEYLENVTPDKLPPSYRVVPREADPDIIKTIGARFTREPGVREVVFAEEAVRDLLKVSRVIQAVILGLALVLLMSASLLIFNTIRMAIFARRREIEVMKLVGATNWFIRVPFMLEGLFQGLAGTLSAFAVLYVAQEPAQRFIRDARLFEQFAIFDSQVLTTGLFMVVIGSLLGAVGAGVAASRFLDI
ncbi:MAG: ABC transporter permease [Actinobacteria bacterium]|nr:ABC transporter permease [Actinomycetota bacterium]